MIKNGKFFVPPQGSHGDLKELFNQLAAKGAGRPIDKEGFPAGPWTPELLADAIAQIEANRSGIDLRTVQLWFQDNNKGISTTNIWWLARIFGCGDPQAASEWQAELSAAQSRLIAKRRNKRRTPKNDGRASPAQIQLPRLDRTPETSAATAPDEEVSTPRRGLGLAARSAALFSQKNHLNLPIMVFAGAVGLGFLAFIMDVHSINYSPKGGSVRQVGFLWAPNWTLLFLLALPLYLWFVVDLLVFWEQTGRLKLGTQGKEESKKNWTFRINSFSSSYWAIFLMCLPVAGLLQWIDRCLGPLLTGDLDNYAVEWARLAIVRPDIISVTEAIVFTGLAYLYMALCFFLFFAGLILLCTLAYDFCELARQPAGRSNRAGQSDTHDIGRKIMRGIFRSAVLGLLIAICMKLQSTFMLSGERTIVSWLINDFLSIIGTHGRVADRLNYSMPTNYSSLLVVIATCAVFLYGAARIHTTLVGKTAAVSMDEGQPNPLYVSGKSCDTLPWARMTAVLGLLAASYLLIGVFQGFSGLLTIVLSLGIYSLFDPALASRRGC
ncbi:RcgA family putative transporter [Pseudosulfitobacter pseudonitzschiae]|uniref:RcgA family putative transporter n=1 Tax=Pseudosulfitobacter pseudonitzschiae TaxID=1402135 RepID=UPI001AF7BC58|nr:hypothetical protein JNX04_21400 [Pseudosulfitobacter pseudonitzschiae]QSH66223.1 hypothetical protein JQK82_020640 [Pseudosulfitobacter pseudonitzschiae]QSH71006.1 hypothetical protein JQK83_021095 [Pseudosulfitobacter pseudonitzschiae]